MANISLHNSSAPPSGTFATFTQVIGAWRRRSQERRELAQLDARSLRDLGLNPVNIQFEANKPFWQS